MLRSRRKKIGIILLIILFFVLVAALAFMVRTPVLIVTDPSFDRIYGPGRLMEKRIQLSRELFRRVIPVSVAETAGDDLLILAVEAASGSPGMVLFPYRHLEGARYYKRKYPEVPVFIMGGAKPRNEASLTFVRTNSEDDLYRAGLYAGILAGEGRVLFFGDGNVSDYDWEAFVEGLKAREYSGNPVFINISSDYSSYSDVGCAVLSGSASKFLERNLKIPVILFSWLDPGLTPRSVKVVFDDSPWALAAEAIKKFTLPDEEILVSSRPLVIADRMDKKDFRNMKGVIKEKFQKN